ncbi:transposase [Peribacillus loiseleuriae]|uniref:transposase n=1 Tax=Peribacillus loiseleuriae TaxID=1679170 RepID=UPI003808D3DE
MNDLFTKTLQGMIEAEMDTHLVYEKYYVQNKQTSNSRNGNSTKKITSEYGEQETG